MKKSYKKPELFYEDFTLMDSIANCGRKVGALENTCSWTDPDNGLNFFGNTDICAFEPYDDSICYHVPASEIVLFNS